MTTAVTLPMGRSAPAARIGERIGDYTIDRALSPSTYVATHVLLPRRARLVVADPGVLPAAVGVMREACVLEALRHPGVPRVYECGVLADRRPWIATELVEGTSITGPLPLVEVAALVRDVAEILSHAHRRNLTHRHVRPESIMRCDVATRGYPVCVIDWAGARIGTSAGAPSDIHALGILAYEALTGEAPSARAVRELGTIAPLLDDMLADDPARRPSAADVRAEAEQIARQAAIALAIDDDSELVDEMVRPPRRPRWTPPLGELVPSRAATPLGVIKPRT